jgi:DNA repair protein RadC
MKQFKPYLFGIYSVTLTKTGTVHEHSVIHRPDDAARILSAYIGVTDREQFVVMMLATSGRVLGINTVTVGTADSSLVHPREVFKPAILAGATSIIIAHNHPGGTNQPSNEDLSITRQLVEASKIIGIPIRDHVIIADDDGYYSFAEHGQM